MLVNDANQQFAYLQINSVHNSKQQQLQLQLQQQLQRQQQQ